MDIEQANKCWQSMQQVLLDQLGQVRYDTWFKSLKVYSTDNNTLVLHCKDKFVVDFVNQRYKNTLFYLSYPHFGVDFANIKILTDDELEQYQRQLDASRLNPRYTFDSFIVGQANRMAQAASMAVAEFPGTEYNPLFIYGGAGLGKTHLITAIANYVLMNNPKAVIEFSNAEKFTNEVVEAIRSKHTQELRSRMRNVDMLFIDDIQFLANRTATQEEFFNTFNELYSARRQIVITSDRPPDEIATLEERMTSRFKSGIVVDIGKPDIETRMAILRSKAASEKIDISEEAVSLIAESIDTNIRELEGCLTAASLMAKLENSPSVTAPIVLMSLKDKKAQPGRRITPEKIIEAVAKSYHVDPKDILSPVRSREFTVPRQLAIYLTREMCGFSTTKTGEVFKRDHSTVMHACKKTEQMLEDSLMFKITCEQIRGELGAK
ncbi:MAG: chromosomal replication initiator protein DnaA [Clostridia bacterium]|nr:chromosomal replication initiator protein DnaA [Clostridia bacterium]